MKPCIKCGVNPRQSSSNKGRGCHCKQCWSDRANEWNKKNRDRVRDLKFRRKFGITLADYNRTSEAQNHVCAICFETDPAGIFLAQDHNHETKKNRGLLCGSCNRAIGLLKESPAILHRSIEYLNEWKRKHYSEEHF